MIKNNQVNRRRFLKSSLAGAAFLTFSKSPLAQTESPIATTKYGKVRGYIDHNVNCFKGVRYGADTSAFRFQSPRPPQNWTNIQEAIEYAKSAPQQSRTDNVSEDCLFLNVFTPKLRDGVRRPVMFYIHGGAYANGSGSSPLYDGVRLCNRGNVVVVSINHRLNAFGYLYLSRFGGSDFADSGNAGQLDIILALRWVKENIAEFGGDPNNVLVFGQSGGGAKIATLMAMPAAKNLFHKAATMSGQQVTACGPWNGTLRAKAILDALKLSKENIQQVRTMPFEKIVEVLNTQDPVLPFGGINFAPALDEKNLLRHPFYPDAPSQSNQIPMIIGNTHDETRAFLGGDETNFKITWDELPEKLIPQMRVDIKPEEVIEKYRKLYPNLTASDLLFKITTASRSWRGAIIEAEERAKSGFPAFAYQLDWKSTRENGKFGAPHGADIQLVFDNIAKPGATAQGPTAQKMADIMSETFIKFAKTGHPNHKMIPIWKPYTMAKRETMVFDTPSHLENDPRSGERRIFEKVPYVQPGT